MRCHHILQNVSPLNESCLITANQPASYNIDPICQHFSENFVTAIQEADWPEFVLSAGISSFGIK
jgi:hypothetical protein